MNESLLQRQSPNLQTQNPQGSNSGSLQLNRPTQNLQSDVLGIDSTAQLDDLDIVVPDSSETQTTTQQVESPVTSGINPGVTITAVVVIVLVVAALVFVWTQRHEGNSFSDK